MYLLFDFWRTIIDPPEDLDQYYLFRVKRILEVEGVSNEEQISKAFRIYTSIFKVLDARRRSEGIEIPGQLEVELLLKCIGVDEIREEHMLAYASPMLELTRVKPFVRETLNQLRNEGYKMAIVSNTPYHPMVEAKLRRENLLDYFDAIVSSHRVGLRKPLSRIFMHAVELLGGNINGAIMIGDSPYEDIMGAKRLGMKAIWVFKENEKIHPPADAVIKRFSELITVLKVI